MLKDPDAPAADDSPWPELTGEARKRGMLWMVISFIFSGYLMGAVMTLWVTNVQDLGHSAAMAALAGAVADASFRMNWPDAAKRCHG